MKTIICGAGDVGYSIADKLSRENFEVTVIFDIIGQDFPRQEFSFILEATR